MRPENVPSARSEWRAAAGTHRYVPVLLTHPSNRGCALTGLALLAVESSSHFVYPGRFAEEFSRIALEVGDVSAVYV